MTDEARVTVFVVVVAGIVALFESLRLGFAAWPVLAFLCTVMVCMAIDTRQK